MVWNNIPHPIQTTSRCTCPNVVTRMITMRQKTTNYLEGAPLNLAQRSLKNHILKKVYQPEGIVWFGTIFRTRSKPQAGVLVPMLSPG